MGGRLFKRRMVVSMKRTAPTRRQQAHVLKARGLTKRKPAPNLGAGRAARALLGSFVRTYLGGLFGRFGRGVFVSGALVFEGVLVGHLGLP